MALDAFARHHQITGTELPEAADFAALNALNAPGELCQRIAEYQNHSRLREISVTKSSFDPDGSGPQLRLEVRYGGSLVLPYVAAKDDAGRETTGMIPFGHGTEAHGTGESMLLIPFGGKVYALNLSSNAPDDVWDWQGQSVCHFASTRTPAIAQSADDETCRALLDGPLPAADVQTHSYTGGIIDIDAGSGRSFWTAWDYTGITDVVDVDLSGAGPLDHVGYFTGFRSHGGCQTAGAVLLEGDKQQRGPRNDALLDAEFGLQDCKGPHARVVQRGGRYFIEFDAEQMNAHNELTRRTLLRITGRGLETICRIVEKSVYVGTPN